MSALKSFINKEHGERDLKISSVKESRVDQKRMVNNLTTCVISIISFLRTFCYTYRKIRPVQSYFC